MGNMSRALTLTEQLARNANRQQEAYAELTKALAVSYTHLTLPTNREV